MRPIDHDEFLLWIIQGRLDARRALDSERDDGFLQHSIERVMARAARHPGFRRKLLADLMAMGGRAGGKVPPNDVEIACVWRAYEEHYAGRVVNVGRQPSRNAAVAPIAMRLDMPRSKVKTILYEHEPAKVSGKA
jgi:hypothetical protein